MKLGEAILQYRIRYNLSMKKFAELCGCTQQTIYNLETVGSSPSKLTRGKITNILSKDGYTVEDDDDE